MVLEGGSCVIVGCFAMMCCFSVLLKKATTTHMPGTRAREHATRLKFKNTLGRRTYEEQVPINGDGQTQHHYPVVHQ
jgi:hypothetical protein